MKQKKLIWFLLIIIFSSSCKKNVDVITPIENLSDEHTEIRDRLAQISMITSVVFAENPDLSNQYVKSVKNKLAAYPEAEESLTFMEILKDSSFIEPGFSGKFVKKYLEKFNNNKYPRADKFAALTEKIKSRINKDELKDNLNKVAGVNFITPSGPGYSSSTDTIFIASLGGQLYFPYSQNFTAIQANQFWNTSDPLSDVRTSVQVNRMGIGAGSISSDPTTMQYQTVSGEWAENVPTLVANICDPVDARPMNPTTPPPPLVVCSDLTYNTVPNLDNSYTISNSIPSVRLLENIRYGFWSSSNRIDIYQAYVRLINPTINATSGTLAVDAPNRLVGSARIKRREARKQYWVSFGSIWNPYWNMEQKDNYLLISYRKSFISFTNISIGYNVNGGITYDATRSRWVPSFTGSVTGSGSISIGKNYGKYGEDWIPRASILTNAVGDIFNLGTTVSQNIYTQTPFTIRQLNKFQYYFKTNVCH